MLPVLKTFIKSKAAKEIDFRNQVVNFVDSTDVVTVALLGQDEKLRVGSGAEFSVRDSFSCKAAYRREASVSRSILHDGKVTCSYSFRDVTLYRSKFTPTFTSRIISMDNDLQSYVRVIEDLLETSKYTFHEVLASTYVENGIVKAPSIHGDAVFKSVKQMLQPLVDNYTISEDTTIVPSTKHNQFVILPKIVKKKETTCNHFII